MAIDGRPPVMQDPEPMTPIVFGPEMKPLCSVGRLQDGAHRAQFIRLEVLNSSLMFGPNSALRIAAALTREAEKMIAELGFTTSDAVH